MNSQTPSFMTKQQLRNWVKEERKKLNIETLSQTLVSKLQSTEEYKQAKNIMIYYPLKYEVNLLSLLKDKTKKFYLPKINGNNLLCCPFDEKKELCESCFKTKEPLTQSINKTILDLVIVPALAVDKKNFRLGYGGGFYDRFLKNLDVCKIVCISERYVVENIYPEKHDIIINKIITA